MNWLYYIAEANLYLGVFYLAYCLFLTKETYYQLTRAYLLFACVVSFILPVLQIGALKPIEAAVNTTVTYTLPEYTAPQEYIPTATAPVVIERHLTVADYLVYAYFIGAGIVFLMLLLKLFTLFKLFNKAKRIAQDKHKLIYLPETNAAFSFFNYLFIGTNASGLDTIIRHELVHIRQKHSVDIIFLELLKVVSWFNPFIYLLQNSLKTVHEYIADEQTAAYETDALTYSSFLVNNAYGAGGSSITHSFFNYNLLKKRIVMLNQKRSGNLARLKYLVAVPVCAGLLCVSTLAFSKTYGWVDIDPAKPVQATTETAAASPTDEPKKFPPPSVFKKGYGRLMGHVQQNVHYTEAVRDAKNSFVGVSFNVKADRTISDVTIFKSAGNGYDAIAKEAFAGFDGVVLAKPGKHTFMLNFFSEKGSGEDYPDGNYDVNLVIVRPKPGEVKVKFPPPAPKKPDLRKRDKNGAYISEGRLNNGAVPVLTVAPKGTKYLLIVDGKKYEFTPESLAKYNSKSLLYMSCDKMAVYEQGNKYAEKTWGKGYGKVAVLTGNASIRIVQEPFGDYKIIPAAHPTATTQPATAINGMTRDDYEDFSKYISRNTKYPSADRQERIGGRVITVFEVDANGNLQYAKVVRTPSEAMSNEVMRVLKKWPRFSMFKPGIQYALPVTYTLGYEDSSTPLLEVKTRPNVSPSIYNPNVVDIPDNPAGSLMLSDVIIRGYLILTISDAEKTDLQQLGKYISANVKYPAADRQETIGGRVITVLSVDAEHNLQYAKVVRTPSAAMGNEVIRVLKRRMKFDELKPGVQYTLPISFTLGYEGSSEIIDLKSRSTGTVDIYNPNAVDIQINQPGSLSISDVVIRGYIKK